MTRQTELNPPAFPKLATHIEGFDLIALGGLPEGRSTLLSGTSGSSKTVFAAQFLAAGIMRCGESGVFITFEEDPEDIRHNMIGFGWDIATWENEGRWAFVDASPQPGDPHITAGGYDLGALLARIEHGVKKVGARRVVLDSLGGVFAQLDDDATIRRELFRISKALRKLGVTSVITAERVEEHGPISRYGVEEFVSDNVVVLRNMLQEEVRRRTVEILKFRGANHQKGEWPFTIVPGHGVVVIPLSALELKQKSSDARISSGSPELDLMCGGGFFRDSIVLISGPTGTGKTLITTEFLAGGDKAGERCLLFAFEESREQLVRNASGWGVDFARMEAEGRLKVVCTYPEAAALEDHLIHLKREIEQFKPSRLAVDSLSALERVAPVKSFREFVIGLVSFVKHQEIPGLFTATTSSLLGGDSITETHLSTITDSIILLRYVEMHGDMRRGLTVLKMRGSRHDKQIREFTIDSQGMHIGQPFRELSGILSGNFRRFPINVGSGQGDGAQASDPD
ncbi:circadian clock protein KaiC [Paludisphaera borealis]|uniref:non-specific serine/threonine protein kinase n=1 Tax=Paludisphaera borealis TaxID=1387353 RepID=A0A1U7CSS1_9BACT|nr:circadian clock protein KaiC [Paludisphaera borealis]APW61958.1 Circadian clock protein kinase KaiC [Paludisphaera borealis]